MNLITKIDNYLVTKENRERTSYYPSEVSKCIRQMYYKWEKIEVSNPISAGGYWKMNMGNKLHELVSEFLVGANLEIVDEVSFKYDAGLNYPISGRIDNLFMEGERLCGIEIKTTYGAGIRAIRNKGYPKDNDIEQVLVYMGCTDIEKFYILYIGRDDGYRTQFKIEKRNGQIFCDNKPVHITFEKLLDKFRDLEDYRLENRLPDRQFKVAIKNGAIKDKFQKNKVVYKSMWCCMYCQYANKCWEDILNKEGMFYGEDKIT